MVSQGEPSPRLRRRTLIMTAAATGPAALLGGCTTPDNQPGSPSPAPSVSATSSGATSAAPAAPLVVDAADRAWALQVQAQLVLPRRRYRTLLRPVTVLHGQQAAGLERLIPPRETSVGGLSHDLAAQVRAEEAWRTSLAEDADGLPDGPLARVFATLAAGQAMVVAHLGARSTGTKPDLDPGLDSGLDSEPGPDADVELLQAALADEHAALYAYGVLGGRALPDDLAGVTAAYDAHRTQRDRLVSAIAALGVEPVAAEAAYDVAAPARRLVPTAGADLELGMCSRYAEAVGSSAPGARAWARAALEAAAVRALGFGSGLRAFPGAPELEVTP